MKKFTLVFILSILFISFAAAFWYVYQYGYLSGRLQVIPTQEPAYKEPNGQQPQVTPTVGEPSVYEDYTQDKLDDALNQGRVVFLHFTANWCQDCISQDNVNTKVVAQLPTQGVVGLRVHILDSESTTETSNLAKKFSVGKENSIIVLNKVGAVSFRNIGNISLEVLKEKIEAILQQ